MIKRLSEDEFFKRVNMLWEQFHSRPEMVGISFEKFKEECYKEFQKQNQMSDKKLEEYRNDEYKAILKETNKLTTKQERQKLNKEDSKIITMMDKH